MLKFWVGIILFVGMLGYMNYRFLMLEEDMHRMQSKLTIIEEQVFPGTDMSKLQDIINAKQVDQSKKHRLMMLMKDSVDKAKKYMHETIGLTEKEIDSIIHPESSDKDNAKDKHENQKHTNQK